MAIAQEYWHDPPALTDEQRRMRSAASFVHYLRYQARGDWRSSTLREYWQASETDDRERFTALAERIASYTVYWCDDCGEPVFRKGWHGSTHEDTDVCQSCLDNYYWCDDCGGYYSESHDHTSQCDAPHPRFRFPLADGRTVGSDDLFDVATPSGVISDTGIEAVAEFVYGKLSSYNLYKKIKLDMDREWTNRSGNFTKRLAKLALQQGYKLEPPVLAEVGNIARSHSGGSSYRVAFTRDLNAPAEDFAHPNSCWWTSESESRCALKQEGGLGLRTFDADGNVHARAWVLPLARQRDAYGVNGFELTDDPVGADAFVLFNTYHIDGYEAARMLAQITGLSYRKISFACDPMYVNAGGFLIAPVQDCERTSDLHFEISLECGCK